jgi:hypothetical protein
MIERAPRKDIAFPTLVYGLGVLPIPQRFYFSFGAPIESKPYQERPDEEEAIFALREEVRVALQRQIDELLVHRDADPERPLSARLRKMLS